MILVTSASAFFARGAKRQAFRHFRQMSGTSQRTRPSRWYNRSCMGLIRRRRNCGVARPVAIVAITLLIVIVLTSPPAAARQIGPGADLCGEINALPAGEELVL